MSKREILRAALACPGCKTRLQWEADRCRCTECGAEYRLVDEVPRFVPEPAPRAASGFLYSIKQAFRRLPFLYDAAHWLIGQAYCGALPSRKLLRGAAPDALILNVGSGTKIIDRRAANIDLFAYPNVDVVADILRLPFADNSVDWIVNEVVLEHVETPEAVVREFHRVLKPGGKILSVAPFLQCYHDAPRDYTRWTARGFESLHRDFQPLKTGVVAGPASALCWVLQEFLACLLSFGLRPLYQVWQVVLLLLLWPLKFLDVVMIHMPGAENAASVLYFHGMKPPAA